LFKIRRGTTFKKGDPVFIRGEHLSGTIFETHKNDVEVSVITGGIEERRHFSYDVIERLLTLDEMAPG
jgi:hypothetical protein